MKASKIIFLITLFCWVPQISNASGVSPASDNSEYDIHSCLKEMQQHGVTSSRAREQCKFLAIYFDFARQLRKDSDDDDRAYAARFPNEKVKARAEAPARGQAARKEDSKSQAGGAQ